MKRKFQNPANSFFFCVLRRGQEIDNFILECELISPLPLVRVFVGSSAVAAPEDTRQLTLHFPPVTAPVFRTHTAHTQLRLTTDTNCL
jgi:hypothetical protein